MTKKNWIWTTIIIAAIHGIVIFLIAPHADDVLWSRFDSNPYQSTGDQFLLILFIILFLPYYLLTILLSTPGPNPIGHLIMLIGNSLVWGLLGAWLVSFLPFMKDPEPPEQNT